MAVWNRRKAAALAFGGMAAFYLLCVPTGAVRLSVAMYGHPLAAVTCRVTDGFVHSWIDEVQEPPFPVTLRPFHVEQPVIDRPTAETMENWAVYRLGPFCLSKHWGYC